MVKEERGNAILSFAKELLSMPNEAEIIPPDPRADAEREERIRKRAYQLWEEDGAPEGRAEEYWHRARQLIDQGAGSPGDRR